MEGSTDHRTYAGRIPPQVNAPLASAPAIRTADVIRKKRDGVELSRSEIEYLVRGYTSGEIPDYQAAAWLMSAVIRGLTRAETAALTDAMLRSGEVLDLSEFSAKKIDKDSTGGGGGKKLAEGIDGLVLDVKTGSGAFMKKEEDAIFLAELMVETGERMGKQVTALITDMDQPLGLLVGNSLEVAEVLDVLRGAGPQDLRELCLELAGWMFLLGGAAASVTQGRQMAEQIIRSGKALEKFGQMVALQGGDSRVIADPRRLPQAEHKLDVLSSRSGCVMKIDCEAVGIACVILGGGREKKEDSVDPSVGLALHKKVGDSVATEEPLCTIHYNSEARAARAKTLIEASYQIGDTPPTKRPIIHRVIGKSGDKN